MDRLRVRLHQIPTLQAPKSPRRIPARDTEVERRERGVDVRHRRRRPRQDHGVEISGVLGRDALRDRRARRVPHPDHAREAVAAHLRVPQLLHERVRDFHLERTLHHLQRVRVLGFTHPDPVVREGRVSGCHGVVDVAVSGGDVPVGAVQGVAVRQELDGLDGLGGAGRGRDAELAVDGESIFDRGRATVYSREERAVGFQQLDEIFRHDGLVDGRGEENLDGVGLDGEREGLLETGCFATGCCGLAGRKRGIRSREGVDCCIEKYYGGGQVFERAIHLDRSTGWCLPEYSDES